MLCWEARDRGEGCRPVLTSAPAAPAGHIKTEGAFSSSSGLPDAAGLDHLCAAQPSVSDKSPAMHAANLFLQRHLDQLNWQSWGECPLSALVLHK
jgi:hypothetical protein